MHDRAFALSQRLLSPGTDEENRPACFYRYYVMLIKETMFELLFTETTTIGVRSYEVRDEHGA